MTTAPRTRPGGLPAQRPLHFIWMLDGSGSMKGRKIQALNNAIRESIPHMRSTARTNPGVSLLARALVFADDVQWHIAEKTPVDKFEWTDINAGGRTAMGEACRVVAGQLTMQAMELRAVPPVLVLITDGLATDNFEEGLRVLLNEKWGAAAIRLAITLDDDTNLESLQRFIAHPERKPLEARNADDLVSFIRWCSTAVVRSASTHVNGLGATLLSPPTAGGSPVPGPKVW